MNKTHRNGVEQQAATYPSPDMGCPDLLDPRDPPRRRMGRMHGWERAALRHAKTLAAIAAVCLGYYLARN